MSLEKDFIRQKVRTMCEKLDSIRYTHTELIKGWEYAPCDYKKGKMPERPEKLAAFDSSMQLEGKDCHFVFYNKIKTPAPQEGKELFLEVITGKEGGWDASNPQCIVYLNGETAQALDVNHTTIKLEFGKEYDVCIYFYIGAKITNYVSTKMTNVSMIPSFKILDTKINKLYYDLKVPYDALCCIDDSSYDYVKLVKCLDEATMLLDFRSIYSDGFYKGIDAADEFLSKELYNGICGNSEAVVSCVGHTHIDVAWLWQLRQTAEKAHRTFSTVLALMERYPDFKFMSSQPQLYKYVKMSDPKLYERIKQRVKEGRWEVEGAMWLEADTNLSSGESLVRQILFGKRFMKNEFGVESKILWLPDVFGYSAALPQILKKSGVDKFFTAKLSWNQVNPMPHDTFIWEVIDGTDVFANIINGYVNELTPEKIHSIWNEYKDKKYTNNILLTYGFGDGGGGPTDVMCENYERTKYGIPGLPKTEIRSGGEFFDMVEKDFLKNAEKLKSVPKWVGELYLEMHRGTYTSIAKNKRNNRKSELLYQSAETAGVICSALTGSEYPQDIINENWETILLNQFHDIIPGSSIFEVYEDSDKQYAHVLGEGEKIYTSKIDEIADNISTDGGIFVYNPNSFPVSGTVSAEGKSVYVSDIPPLGWSVVKDGGAHGSVRAEGRTLENELIRVELDENGDIVSVYDKEAQREVIKHGEKANRLEAYEDYPHVYDAWEISPYYKQKMWRIDDLQSMEAFNEDCRAGFKIVRSYGKSRIEQKIVLGCNSKRIDFENEIDWHEDHILLKAAFPFDVRSDKATYEIQFGHIERPTHENTSWDEAKFEVCAHKWADISEYGYGVSLLNDCKYGYNTEGSTMKLSLLKCATRPNPHADQGHHSFVYSLYPHTGDFRAAKTVQESYKLNKPLVVKNVSSSKGTLPESFSLIKCSADSVIIDTVKKAEDSGDIIVRAYEAYNSHTKAVFEFGVDIKEAYLCGLMENEIEKLDVNGRSVSVDMSNFELVTLKIKR